MSYRPQFSEALGSLAHAIHSLIEEGYPAPILVGGGAVEFYTGGAIVSGDFDVVTPFQRELERALVLNGFERPNEPEILLGGVVNRQLKIAVQVVSGALMDGKADPDKVKLIEFDEKGEFAIIPVEDLIADRMAQAYSVRPIREDMLFQSVILYRLAEEVDEAYLDKRICEETYGDANLASLKDACDAAY